MPPKPGKIPQSLKLKPIAWDSSMSVGVEAIDFQHKRIAEYIKEFEKARESRDKDLISNAIFNLFEYIELHFQSEETLMEEAGYPLLETHRQVHRTFAARLGSYFERHEKGEDITTKLMSDLTIWWTTHVAGNDLDYAPHTKKLPKSEWIKRLLNRDKES